MGDKINFLGSLTQVVRLLELAHRDYDNLYTNGQIRMPAEDILFVSDRLKEIKKLVADIKLINEQFEMFVPKNV